MCVCCLSIFYFLAVDNRLGQRVIQMQQGPMILTGFSGMSYVIYCSLRSHLPSSLLSIFLSFISYLFFYLSFLSSLFNLFLPSFQCFTTSALNKLLGKEVYTSQDQLGGPQIMYPNGVTHEGEEENILVSLFVSHSTTEFLLSVFLIFFNFLIFFIKQSCRTTRKACKLW